MPLPSTLRLVPDLNMCPRHLPDLADLAALASDHTANQLEGRQDLTLSKGLDPWIPLPPSPTAPQLLLTSLGTRNSCELVCVLGSSPEAEEKD